MNGDRKILIVVGTLWLVGMACSLPLSPAEDWVGTEPVATDASSVATEAVALLPSSPGDVIQPEELEYLGAFRLPDGPDEYAWKWSGNALTYYPDGDLSGESDGFPGSLFGTGHDWNTYVSEISIPAPVISRNLENLNTAVTLQPFADIRNDMYGYLEVPRVGLEYLPAQGEQDRGKLYFAFAPHMGEAETNPSHGWAELDLSNSQATGTWHIGDHWNYFTGDYLFAIPPEWGDAYFSGMNLATGRYRDGGQASMGPTIYAIAPWQAGDPPAAGATLDVITLLQYGSIYDDNPPVMNNYSHADEWEGAAWVTSGGKSAVIIVGTKALGTTWYGCLDGTIWPDQPPFPPECAERGWWSERFEGQILFYDPNQFFAVANGELEAWQPQPYAVLQIDDVLYGVEGPQQKSHVRAVAYDRAGGLIYIVEPLVDDEKSIIHVWRITP